MGKVVLGRVDERLIHGQVMITLSQKDGVNSIFVVDDVVYEESFMKELYKSAGNRTGKKTIVLNEKRAFYYWDKYKFKDYNCILVAKSVDVFYKLIKHGVEVEELNVGGIAKKSEDDLLVTKSVYLNKKDADKLKELRDDYNINNIYFQATPSAPKTSLDEVLKKF
ncbi:MAG: PTS sugar transporter subunit IIB [Anaerococcus hydrogenalis]|uniref:PTS system mannose/fructose/N-acetylgalactosamine-transporter subunit IIB n=1 Tax=Anaerococcus hydrogenalis TaxID=33029 RepID=UPI0028FFA1ED|nr:PTS sugar transporter subunit IIB [Anaerococcus hydrogenalis]MDU2582572.1 PTS sugar transporter subunit IIB [Anaerococcus hydrogenalis]